MKPLLAIVGDTWRQSRQQVVFIIMLVLLLLTVGAGVALPKVFDRADGGKDFGLIFEDEPAMGLSRQWNWVYAERSIEAQGKSLERLAEDDEHGDAVHNAIKDADIAAAGISPFERSVEMWVYIIAWIVFTISMLFFIAACAGYFPDLLAGGAIDMVLAKPVTRRTVFFGKYLGGLALFSAALFATLAALYVGVGIRTGVWTHRIFLVIPLTVFSAAVLYAILALIGLKSRSSTLAVIMGYLFYVVVDSIVTAGIDAQRMGAFKDIEWLDTTVATIRTTMPNFGELKSAAISSVLNVPGMYWPPILTAGCWLSVFLALGLWLFRRADY